MDSRMRPAEAVTFTMREQILWTLFGLALFVAFIAMLVEDQAL